MTLSAIVLCGGGSTRMGRDKAGLPFGDETMLSRVIRIVGEVTNEIVVARDGQEVWSPLTTQAYMLRLVYRREKGRRRGITRRRPGTGELLQLRYA